MTSPRAVFSHLLLALVLAAIAAAPTSDPVATDACGEVEVPEADPDSSVAPAGETVPALDVCGLQIATTWADPDGEGPTVLESVTFTITLAGDVAERPAGAEYVVAWTGPNQGRECYHVIWYTEPLWGDPHAEVGGSCRVSDEVLNSYEFLDGAFPVEAVTLDGTSVTFTVDLASADPALLDSLAPGGTLTRPAALTYVDSGLPAFSPLGALWDTTTETRDVVLTPPA